MFLFAAVVFLMAIESMVAAAVAEMHLSLR